MISPSSHYAEELQDLLDERLSEPRRSEVAAHVADCVPCQRELDALRWVKAETPKHFGEEALPADLLSRVRSGLDAEDAKSRLGGGVWQSRRAWIVTAIAAAALLAVFFPRQAKLSLPDAVAADFQGYEAGTTPLEFTSADTRAVEAYFARNGIAFPTRVFDLGMMNYRLVGGRVNRLDGRSSALFAYAGPGGKSLVCQMYEGRIAELPTTSDVREHNGITFYVHRSGGRTIVFWQEGEVICVLVSDVPPEDVVQLAFAKAVRVESVPASRG